MGSEDFLEDFAGEFFKLTWQDRSLAQGIEDGPERVKNRMFIVLQRDATKVENYAKVNAPWTDRTGNARQGLRAEAFREGDNLGIILYGQVPYQIWLELARSGEYAIIGPTIDAMGPEVMNDLRTVMEDM